jgi:hypothetical protein
VKNFRLDHKVKILLGLSTAIVGASLLFITLSPYEEMLKNVISHPTPTTTPPSLPANGTLTYDLPSSDSRTIIPIQMKLPDGLWSAPIKFNFDTGASWPTDVPLELLADFGAAPDGVPSDERKEQPGVIRIPGLDGEYNIPIMIQDKDHYDLFRTDPNRYPLLRIRDITDEISMVFTNKQTVLRLGATKPPELTAAPASSVINLPDMMRRTGTPTSGWQWNQVTFKNPATGLTFTDWMGLNTGDVRIVVKKSLADTLGLPLTPGRNPENFDTHATIEFIESTPIHAILDNIAVEARDDNVRFGRGGPPRNFGLGLVVLDKYSIAIWGGLHWALISNDSVIPPPPPPPPSPEGNVLLTSAAWANGHARMLDNSHQRDPDDNMFENSGGSP